MNITVRRAEQRDLAALAAAEPRPDIKLSQRRFDEMSAGTGILAVAELDGQLLGTGYLEFADTELFPEVKNLWVFPEQRRHGAGRALFSWLEDQARAAGHDEVFLSVAPTNFVAIPLFLDMGYAPTGSHLVIDNPNAHEVADPDQVSQTYAIYQKSLRAY